MDYTDKRNTMIRYIDVVQAEDDQAQYLMMEEVLCDISHYPSGLTILSS